MKRRAPRRGRRSAIALIAAVCAAALAGGCGGEDHTVGGTATVEMSTAPDYLDPQLGYTTEAAEADWIAYTPLLTYRHKSGPSGADLIPGLAAHLPQISPNGKRYTFTLRQDLVYSNGLPVQASDFEYTIERALRLGWAGSQFITDHVVGASEYESGEAADISGITVDDATGTIEILLRHPYGPFANVLALPATGLVPSGTAMTDLSGTPPPGVGAYRITDVVPNRSWTMVKNPSFDQLDIPDVPVGTLDRIKVRINPNRVSAADDVIGDRADGYDPGTPLPAAALAQATSGDGQFEDVAIFSTLYFFLNSTTPPFNSELARRAVLTALDRPALGRLSNQTLEPECYLLPDGVPGHTSSSCPYGAADEEGDMQAAEELVQESGTAGTPITVWGADRPPQRAYVRYYVKLLDRLGYRAAERLVQPLSYYAKVASPTINPQTGFASWFNDFPNPADFYEVVDARSTPPAHRANLGRIDDIFIQQQLAELNLEPAQDLSKSAGQWRELEEYTAKKAYLAVFGTQQVPKLMSARMNFDSAVIHPLFLSDWSTWSVH